MVMIEQDKRLVQKQKPSKYFHPPLNKNKKRSKVIQLPDFNRCNKMLVIEFYDKEVYPRARKSDRKL